MSEHLAVVDALERNDPDAAEAALDAHLRSVLHRIFAE
jgi:DNA-binding GntR family transcriptional regulator